MFDELEDKVSLTQLQREKTILDILRLTLWDKDSRGRKYSIESACREVGIDSSTWRKWVIDGLVVGPLKAIAEELHQSTHNIVIEFHGEIVENLIRMCRGLPPKDAPDMEVKASDVLAAIREYSKIVPPRPIDADTARITALEHAETFQPKQVLMVQGDFIYNGGGSVRMGELESIAGELADEED